MKTLPSFGPDINTLQLAQNITAKSASGGSMSDSKASHPLADSYVRSILQTPYKLCTMFWFNIPEYNCSINHTVKELSGLLL